MHTAFLPASLLAAALAAAVRRPAPADILITIDKSRSA